MISIHHVIRKLLSRNSNYIVHECEKRDGTKSQKVSGASFYICRNYRGKTGRGEEMLGTSCAHPEES